jgi:hypothetical protein
MRQPSVQGCIHRVSRLCALPAASARCALVCACGATRVVERDRVCTCSRHAVNTSMQARLPHSCGRRSPTRAYPISRPCVWPAAGVGRALVCVCGAMRVVERGRVHACSRHAVNTSV